MVVQTNVKALKRTKWYEYAIRFALGGLITAVAGLVAKKWGPAVGGLFLAFPAIFPAAATLVAKHERQKKQEKSIPAGRRGEHAAAVESAGATLGSLGLAAFAGLNWYLLGGHNPIFVLVTASIAWLLTSALLWAAWKYRRRITLKPGFLHQDPRTAYDTRTVNAQQRSTPTAPGDDYSRRA